MTTTDIAETDVPETSAEAGIPRWYQRALPVAASVVGLVAVAALVFPGVRHQLVLSTTHQPQSYVELYFGQAADGTRAVCTRDAAGIEVSFTVASHLGQTRDLAYAVSVVGRRQGDVAEVGEGTVHAIPGQARSVTATSGPVGGGYDVSVRLPDVDQEIHARCAGAAG